jgi:hypothetical protein
LRGQLQSLRGADALPAGAATSRLCSSLVSAAVDIAAHRLHSQRLVGVSRPTPAETVRWLGAVQAQDAAGAARALDAGEIVRTHVLRPTWHLVGREDVRWMLALAAPRVRRAMAPYDRKLELDEGVRPRARALISTVLDGGRSLTRTEIGRVLADGGVEASGQRLSHVMMRAELDALALSAGCASTAAPVLTPTMEAGAVARSVVLCTTAEADLRRQLGEPTRDGLLRRDRVVSWITGEDDVVHFLGVMLDEPNVVVDLYWDLPGEVAWTPAGQCR